MKTTQEQEFRPLREPEAFSLVEVVLAVGVIAFALIAILGVLPVGLATQHSAQDDTRAAQIAGSILSSIASQAQANWPSVNIPLPSPSPTPTPYSLHLDRTTTPYVPSLGAANDGTLVGTYSAGMPYQISISTKTNPTGFDNGYACEVIVRVAWQPFSQNYRNFARIVTKY